MNCCSCSQPLEPMDGALYHYLESGLPNVYLANVEVYGCPRCGNEEVRIPNIDALHAAIARVFLLKPSRLTGAEARFLRKHAGVSSKDWAALISTPPETVSRWELGARPIQPRVDLLIRLVYLRTYEETEKMHFPGSVLEDLVKGSAANQPTGRVVVDVTKPSRSRYLAAV